MTVSSQISSKLALRLHVSPAHQYIAMSNFGRWNHCSGHHQIYTDESFETFPNQYKTGSLAFHPPHTNGPMMHVSINRASLTILVSAAWEEMIKTDTAAAFQLVGARK